MKLKNINLMLLMTSISVPLSSVLSCYIGNNSTRAFLEKISDYDWGNDNNNSIASPWEIQENKNNEGIKLNELKELDNVKKVEGETGHLDKIFDYDIFSTSYKGNNAILKQGASGSPIIKTYRPNGNMWSDFGLESHSRKYNEINSIYEWDKKDKYGDFNDLDIKYNKTINNLQKRNYVAKNEIPDQQYVKDKNIGVFYNQFGDASSSDSSIIGNRTVYSPIDYNMNYFHNFITWPSVKNEGWFTPPFSDNTNALHKNGVPSFGLIYMSGWEDVNREQLRNFLEKDINGNYKIVDVLIKMCLEMKFDGWFINNEANGSMPDGYALKTEEISEIIRQFRSKANNIYEKTGKKLKLIYYTNNGSVRRGTNGQWESRKLISAIGLDKSNVSKGVDEIQLDFENQRPGDEKEFINTFGEEFRQKLYSMFYTDNFTASAGNYDYRNYIFNKNLQGVFSETPSTSFSSFGAGTQKHYAESFFNLLGLSKKSSNNKIIKSLMSQEVANYYENLLYTGLNGYVESEPNGNDIRVGENTQPLNELIQQDPRLFLETFDRNTVKDNSFKIINGKYKYSIGYANTFRPFTVLTDTSIDDDGVEKDIIDAINIKTNFSTGSGIYFIDSNNEINKNENNIYPWSNSYMADINPTYKWDFWKKEPGKNTFKDSNTSDGIKYRNLITSDGQLNGYVDYYDPYLKGNSISIGNGYNFNDDRENGNGKIMPGKWEIGTYKWNIMGVNLSKNNYIVKFVVKTTDNDSIKKSNNNNIDKIANDSKVIITTSNNEPKTLDINNIKNIGNGWKEISVNLNQMQDISKNNRIAKIGLQLENKSDTNFIYSVGEFRVEDQVKDANIKNDCEIEKINNEYIVKRQKENANLNIRYNWVTKNESNLDYYEVYLWYENKWLLLKTTCNNADYLYNLDKDSDNEIKIGIRPVFKDNSKGKLYYNSFRV